MRTLDHKSKEFVNNLEAYQIKGISINIKSCLRKLEKVEKEDHEYVMLDDLIVYTSEEKWQEVKFGHVFNESKVILLSEKRSEIVESILGLVKKIKRL